MFKTIAIALLAMFTVIVLETAPAMAEATFADVLSIPGDILKGPGDFVQKVINTPVGSPASYHSIKGSKPVTKMLWCAPKPTLSACRVRSTCR